MQSTDNGRRALAMPSRVAGVWGSLLAGSILLGGCSTLLPPRSLDYEISPPRGAGTITVSYPKVYSREGLLEERRLETEWLNGLMAASKTVAFTPQIVREMENVSALAAALGLSFDPAAGANYRRQSEIADLQQQSGVGRLQAQLQNEALQQEIDLIKLDAQIKQLRADLALLEAKFPDQKDIVTQGLGTSAVGPSGTGTATGASPVTGTAPGAATGQLDAAITKLTTDLNAALAAQGKLPIGSSIVTSPFDDFRDRTAYRDMLRSAMNAAALDELHDLNGANLIRLNFQATVLPQKDQLRSLGALEMRIASSGDTAPSQAEFLDYLNGPAAERSSGAFVDGSLQKSLALSGLMQIISIGKSQVILPSDARLVQAVDGIQRGSVALNGVAPSGGLWNTLVGLNDTQRPQVMADFCNGTGGLGGLRSFLVYRQTLLGLPALRQWLLAEGTLSSEKTAFLENLDLLDRAAQNIGTMQAPCAASFSQVGDSVPAYVSPVLTAAIARASATAAPHVYDIGPRQEVQQVSTVARNASSLALAASIAAADPSSGAAGSAAASYSRRNATLAQAIERVPSVVGFVNASASPPLSPDVPERSEGRPSFGASFGWVFGPRPVLDRYGRVHLRQTLATHDLAVDVSVPGFWRSMQVQVRRSWGGSPTQLADGSGTFNEYSFVVPLRRDQEVFAELARVLLDQAARPKVTAAYGAPINACTPATVVLEGDGIWRARSVFVMGQMIEGTAIRILPDMRGISFTVPKTAQANSPWPPKPDFRLFTPNGSVVLSGTDDTNKVQYDADAFKAVCTPAPPAADPDAPVVSRYGDGQPLRFQIPNKIVIGLVGSNLGKITGATLGNVPAAVAVADGGLSATVTVAKDDTGTIPPGVAMLALIYGKGKLLTYQVQVVK